MLADAMSVAVGPCHCCIALERSSGDPAAPVLGRSDMVPPNGSEYFTLYLESGCQLVSAPPTAIATGHGAGIVPIGSRHLHPRRCAQRTGGRPQDSSAERGHRDAETHHNGHSIPKKWCSGLIGSAGRVWAAGREAGRVYEAASCSIHTYTGVGTEQPYLREQKLYHILAPAAPDSPQTQSQFRLA